MSMRFSIQDANQPICITGNSNYNNLSKNKKIPVTDNTDLQLDAHWTDLWYFCIAPMHKHMSIQTQKQLTKLTFQSLYWPVANCKANLVHDVIAKQFCYKRSSEIVQSCFSENDKKLSSQGEGTSSGSSANLI